MSEKFNPEDKMETKIKECAYEHGLRREKIIDILTVVLRDKLLEKIPHCDIPNDSCE